MNARPRHPALVVRHPELVEGARFRLPFDKLRVTGVVAIAALLQACTSGSAGIEPAVHASDPIGGGTLRFAVGTANIGGAPGLNTMVTLRQADGTSDVALDTPTIAGPTGFVVPPNAPAADAGTNHISGSPQVAPGVVPLATTFGTAGGAFGYGFLPANSTTTGAPNFSKYALPFYAAAQTRYIGGPPAFPQVRDGTYPPGFQGYGEGFTDFLAAPVAGTYQLSVAVPGLGTLTASATLASTALLPAFAPPSLAPDGAGGGTIAVNVPAGATEAYVNVVDLTGACYPSAQPAPAAYTLRTTLTGPQTLTLPPALGPTAPGAAQTPTLCHGDAYLLTAVGFDYPAFASAYPNSNGVVAPAIAGAAGQADLTASAVPAKPSVYP